MESYVYAVWCGKKIEVIFLSKYQAERYVATDYMPALLSIQRYRLGKPQ